MESKNKTNCGIEIYTEGKNICSKLNLEIDDWLVNELKPSCIEEHNGCGNCPCNKYSEEIRLKELEE